MVETECVICGATFNAYPSQQRKYCSRACARAAGTPRKPKTGRYKSCEACGGDFWVVPAREHVARFCSRQCKDGTRTRVECVCEHCGAKFQAAPNHGRRFCSVKCSAARRVIRQAGNCATCGAILDPKRNQFTYCSAACFAVSRRKGQQVPCGTCQRPVWRVPSNSNQRTFCSRACANKGMELAGPGHRAQRDDGYIQIYYPRHPDASASGFILEHRLIASEALGRRLTKSEHVHHINGIKDDNRPENLQVMSAGAHQNITIREKHRRDREARTMLAEYERLYGPLPTN